jgi:Bacterial Ig-like domain (group 1)
MRNNVRRYLPAAMAAAAAALLATPSALGYASSGTSYPLIVVDNGAGSQGDPRTSGNVATYTDDQGGISGRINYFDLGARATHSIPTAQNAIDFLADVSADSIVFTRLSAGGSGIFQYSISGATTTEVAPVAAPASANRRNPTVGGSTVAWEDAGVSTSSDPEIVVASGGTTQQLTNDALADRNPNISQDGQTLVWEKCSATCDVYAATGLGSSWTTTPVAASGANEISPDTNGSHIVYASNAGGDYHVYVTILSGAPTQLAVPGSVSENHPAIAGTFVAFEASNGAQTDIWVYDLVTKTARRITNTPESEVLSDVTTAISGGTRTTTVAWQVAETDSNVYASQFQTSAVPKATIDVTCNPSTATATGALTITGITSQMWLGLVWSFPGGFQFSNGSIGNSDPRVVPLTWGAGGLPYGVTITVTVEGITVLTATLCTPLTLSPAADTNPVGTTHTVTATVQDAAGQPVPNALVRFSVSGSVTTSGQCTSGTNGKCSFSYQGPQLPGADLISAFVDTDGDGVQDQCLVALGCSNEPGATATKAWVLPTSTAGQANGGGQIQSAAGDKISFGFYAKSAGGLQGSCNVVEHGGRMIKCLNVTALVLSGNQATIYGNATDDGAATTYVIHAVDNADPGKGADTFSIQTAGGYSASGTLTAGNVQVTP